MYIKGLELSNEDRREIVRIVKKGRDWQLRERAQTLRYFDAGWEAKAIAAQQELHLDLVYDRRKHWLAEGIPWLTDKYRRGVLAQLTETQREQLRLWASTEALTARQL